MNTTEEANKCRPENPDEREETVGRSIVIQPSTVLTQRSAPVGVFDSGLGGLTVVRELIRQMPLLPFIYVADTAHVPYGPRPASEIRAYAVGIVDALLQAGAASIIAACNMSSALALPYIVDDYDVPILGMIEPGVRAALSADPHGPLGLLATEGTCKSEAYPMIAASIRPGVEIVSVPCPDFVPMVESGKINGPDARAAAERYLKPLMEAGCHTIILGCTHYPWLLPVLREIAGSDVQFIDPASSVVEELRGRLEYMKSIPSRSRFAATAEPKRLEEGAKRFLAMKVKAEYWPIWESELETVPAGVVPKLTQVVA